MTNEGLEKRIVHLEDTISQLIDDRLKKSVDKVYGRDAQLAANFEGLMKRYEDRYQVLEDKFNELTELVEDVLT